MNCCYHVFRCWLISLLLFVVYSEDSRGQYRIYLEMSCRLIVRQCSYYDCSKTGARMPGDGTDCANLSLATFAVNRGLSETNKFQIAVINRESRPMRFTPLRFNPLSFHYDENLYISEGPSTSFYLPFHKMKDHTKLMFSTRHGDLAFIFLQDKRYVLCVYPVMMERNNFLRFPRRSSYTTARFPNATRNDIYLTRRRNGAIVVHICLDNSPTLLHEEIKNNITAAYDIYIEQLALYVQENATTCKKLSENKPYKEITDYIDVNIDDLTDVTLLFDNHESRFMNNEVITYDSTTRGVRNGWLAVVLPIGTTCAVLTILLGFCGENIVRFVS